MKIAIVGVQGDVSEHVEIVKKALDNLGISGIVKPVRKRGFISESDAVIIPGGESTTISRLIWRDGIAEEIIELARDGKPVMGTCAGLILLAKHGDKQVEETDTRLLKLMDIWVRRNAFGRQRESFETEIDFKGIGRYRAIFIRAPLIERVGKGVDVLARIDEGIVAVRERNLLGLAFHPELTGDTRIHEYFISMI